MVECMSEQQTEYPDDVPESEAELIESAPLVQLFQKPSTARIMSTFVMCPEEASITQICESAGVSRTAWYESKETLVEEFNILNETKYESGAKYFAPSDSDSWEAVEKLAVVLRGR